MFLRRAKVVIFTREMDAESEACYEGKMKSLPLEKGPLP